MYKLGLRSPRREELLIYMCETANIHVTNIYETGQIVLARCTSVNESDNRTLPLIPEPMMNDRSDPRMDTLLE